MDSSGFYHKPYVSPDMDDVDDGISRAPKRYFPDSYLDSPILIHKRLRWKAALELPPDTAYKKSQFSRTVEQARELGANLRDYETVEPDQYPRHYHHSWPSTLSTEWTESVEIAADIHESIRTAMKSKTGVTLPCTPSLTDPRIMYWLERWSFFDSLVEEYVRQSALHGANVVVIKLAGHTKVIATRDMWFLKCDRIGSFMYTYEQVLMLKDLMYSRAQCHIAANVFYPGSEELPQVVEATYTWHEKCLLRHGNKGFELLKQTESLSKAYLSEMTDPHFTDNGPYIRMKEKVRTKEIDYGTRKDFLVDQLDLVLRTCTKIEYVVEMFGLLKISGHPLIDPEVGSRSAAAEAKTPDQTLFEDAQALDWEFKRNMLISYIRRNGSWPTLLFTDEGKATKLYRRYQRQFRGLNRNSYPLSDWASCRFGKIVEFDYAPNYLDFLDDKSISLYRDNVAAFWDDDVQEKSHRRLLLELIERETLNVRDIVTLVVRREIPIDWLIVSLHPKEREFKLAPRMFSMLVLEIRLFFALTEANIADKIFPFIPQQTMTLNKVAIARKFLEITKPLGPTDALRMFVEIDLSRWNLRWRAAAVDPVGRTLNDMFGVVGIFDYCHTFFSSAMIVVRVNDLRPHDVHLKSPPETELLWYNHLGGFEGICQKLWTICTYSMISLAVNDLPIGYTLLGQGDNQVMSIVTSRRHDKTDTEVLVALRDQITERVSAQCKKVNQEVKPEECLESTTVITYSKDIYVEGVYYPTTLKFHSRLFPHSAQIFPSVRTNLGAIFSTAVAGGEKSPHPLFSHYLACLYGALYLTRTMVGRGPFGVQLRHFRSRLGANTADFLKFVLTLPSEAGGFPTVPFLGFTYKGGSDPLGKSLSAMHILGHRSGSRLFNRMLAQMSSNSLYNSQPDIRTLFMDPFSIPVKKPVTSTDGVATETLSALRMHVKTRELKELMSADTSSYLDKLVSALGDCTPMNPLILRDILDCSVAGVTDTVGKMFVATRTLQHVVRSMGIPIIDSVLHLESMGLLYLFDRFRSLPPNPAKKCTIYQLTEECRCRWYPSGESPIVGLTTYQPLDFDIVLGNDGLDKEGINAVLVAQSNPLTTRGPYDPYVGSKTREKRSEHGFKIAGTDSASRAMRKLQLIASQTGDDPVFQTILDVVGWSRTNTRLSDVSHLLPGVSGGTLSHRYAARAGHQDAFNIGSPNFATHCIVSTDNTGYLSGGVFDYALMFQEQTLFAIWVLGMLYLDKPSSFSAVTIVTEGTHLQPLPNVDIVGPDKIRLPVLRYPTNPLVFIPDLKLEHVSGAVRHRALPIAENFVPSMSLRLITLEAYFRTLLRKHSMGRQIADGAKQHFQGHTLDLAEVRSNGLWLIAKSIRNVIVDEAISNFMMTDLNNMTRWVVTTYAMKLVSPLASAVTPLIGHPSLVDDQTVVRFGLYDRPSYAGGLYSSHERYCALIQKMIQRALSGADNDYNHRKVGIFTSDNSRILSETLTQCLLCDLYIWVKKGTMDMNEVSLALGSRLLPTLRSQHEESERVAMIVRTSANIGRLIRDKSPADAQVADQLGVSRVTGYRSTIADMLKSTRDTDKWGIVQHPIVPRKILPMGSSHLPPSDKWLPDKTHEVISGTRSLQGSHSSPDALLTEMYYRNLGRVGYYSGTAIFTWSMFGSLLARRPLIVVGSGMGAASRVAIDNGCPHVFGVDLRSSLPLKSHRFRSYKPPLVMGSEYHDRYTQVHESYTSSGDWSDHTVQQAVLNYDSGDMTLLIDIQDASNRFGLSVIEAAVRIKNAGIIILRCYLTRYEHQALCCDLSASGVTFKSYTLESVGSTYPVIFVLTSWTPHLCVATTINGSLEVRPMTLPFSMDPDPFEVSVAQSDALLNLYIPSSQDGPGQIRRQIARIVTDTKGDYDSRFQFGQWTRMLRALLSAEFMSASGDIRMEILLSWYFAGKAFVSLNGAEVMVTVDWNLCHHLCTTVARVCKE